MGKIKLLQLIYQKIEELRDLMVTLAEEKGKSDDRVIEISQELDKLLNKYEQLKKKLVIVLQDPPSIY